MNKSTTFCILPFIHQEVQQDGKVLLCCRAQDFESLGNLHTSSASELWNCESIKSSRLKVLNDEWPTNCGTCKREEADGLISLRNQVNENFKHHLSTPNSMLEDGELPEFKLKFIGLRHSNLCNLKCIYCDHNSSSSWGFDKITKQIQTPFPQGNKELLSYVEEHINELEEIYIAGGEPLIDIRHLELLEMLIDKKATQLRLVYNSNLTSLKIKGVDLIPLWKQFKQVRISASIDDYGLRFEETRQGAKWKNVSKNINLLMENNIDLEIFITVMTKNYMHLSEFFEILRTEFKIPFEKITLNILRKPLNLNIETIPKNEMNIANRKLKIFLKELLIKSSHGFPLPRLYFDIKALIEPEK